MAKRKALASIKRFRKPAARHWTAPRAHQKNDLIKGILDHWDRSLLGSDGDDDVYDTIYGCVSEAATTIQWLRDTKSITNSNGPLAILDAIGNLLMADFFLEAAIRGKVDGKHVCSILSDANDYRVTVGRSHGMSYSTVASGILRTYLLQILAGLFPIDPWNIIMPSINGHDVSGNDWRKTLRDDAEKFLGSVFIERENGTLYIPSDRSYAALPRRLKRLGAIDFEALEIDVAKEIKRATGKSSEITPATARRVVVRRETLLALTGCSPPTLRARIDDGTIPVSRVTRGRGYLIDVAHLADLEASAKVRRSANGARIGK